MLIPYGTDRPLHRATVVTWAFIGLCVAVFAVQLLAGQLSDGGRDRFEMLLALRAQGFRWWMPVTYAFLHASWWHLGGNMLFLWVFGPSIEDRFGRLGFAAFYLVGAAISGGVQIALEPNGVIGASGAIAACTGAYLIMFPRATVKAFSLIFVLGPVTLPAWWFIGFSVLWDLLAQGSGRDSGVAHLAHLSGYAYGAAVSLALLWTKVLPREPYDVFGMARQLYRRQQLKSAVTGQQRELERRMERARNPAANGRHAEDAARTERIASARAEVSRLIATGDLAGAGEAYKRLAESEPAAAGLTTLSRRNQYELANHFFTTGDHAGAVYAYERFLEAYPRDPEAPQIRLLLGRINARYLNDPVRAKALLNEAMSELHDQSAKDMAKRELEALG